MHNRQIYLEGINTLSVIGGRNIEGWVNYFDSFEQIPTGIGHFNLGAFRRFPLVLLNFPMFSVSDQPVDAGIGRPPNATTVDTVGRVIRISYFMLLLG